MVELTPETFPSLGWAMLDWYETYLRVPSGPRYGQPLRLTNEQAVFIVRWYALDKRGAFVYRRGASRRSKGWGKSPLLSAWAIGEFVGPVLFDGWDAHGMPVGKRWLTPWEQIAACSEDQTGNTYSATYAMLADSPALDDFRLDLGRTKVMLADQPHCVIEPVTSSAGSREGQPITAAVLDETHLWFLQNGGRRLAATLRRNVAKTNGRTVESTNAYAPGERSVAEDTDTAHAKGEKGLLYDCVEAPPVEDLTDRVALRKALRVAYGDAKWVDLSRIIDEIQDPATEEADARRFFLNQIVSPSESLVDLVIWSQLVDADGRLVQGDTIALGFDGSDTGDATALIACRYPDFLVVPLAIWEHPDSKVERDGWKVDRAEVDAVVRQTMETYRVVRGYFDPPQWQTEIDGWSGEFGDAVLRWPHASDQRIGPACERFNTMVAERTLRHTADPQLLRHLANGRRARCGPQRHGWWRPVRKIQGRPIDAASAAICAVHALADAVAAGDAQPPKGSTPLFAFSS